MTNVPFSDIGKWFLQLFGLFFIRSSSYLYVNREGIKCWPSSNFSRIGPDFFGVMCPEKNSQLLIMGKTMSPMFLSHFKSSSNLQLTSTCIKYEFEFGQKRLVTSELPPPLHQNYHFSINNLFTFNSIFIRLADIQHMHEISRVLIGLIVLFASEVLAHEHQKKMFLFDKLFFCFFFFCLLLFFFFFFFFSCTGQRPEGLMLW